MELARYALAKGDFALRAAVADRVAAMPKDSRPCSATQLADAEPLELAAGTQSGTGVNTTRLPDNVVLNAIVRKLLTGNTRKAILACARRSFGDARDQRAIRAVSQQCAADPRVVSGRVLDFCPPEGCAFETES